MIFISNYCETHVCMFAIPCKYIDGVCWGGEWGAVRGGGGGEGHIVGLVFFSLFLLFFSLH